MMKKNFAGALALVFSALFALTLLSSCDNPAGGSSSGSLSGGRRALPADFSTRKAVAYSGYRKATNTVADAPSVADIDQDLGLMDGAGFKLLRLFGSDDAFSKIVLQEIANPANGHGAYDIKVQLGIWIDGAKATSDASNQAEIARGVALAKTFPGIVEAVSVGNEKMVDWNTWAPCPAADMLAYIKQVRELVSQPVTTDDNWAVWANDAGKYPTTASILTAVDYVAVHTYALADTPYDLYDWKQSGVAASSRAAAMMDASLAAAKANYAAVRSYMDSKGFGSTPIVIGETGWKSTDPTWTDRAHPVNQKMYYDRLAAWTDGPKAIFYFEAFDEPWKAGDDNWGLWDVSRAQKYVLSGTGYTSSDAVYYSPPVPNGTITKNTYLVYADSVAADATTAVPIVATSWMGWDAPWTANSAEITASGGDAAGEGSKYLQITPVPKVWGWGIFLNNTSPDDLTQFQVSGHLQFRMRTLYAGKLEVGFFTKDVSGNCDVYLPIAAGAYGATRDGSWHDVSIPIVDIVPKAAPAYGQPGTAKINLAFVANPIVIADRYAVTSNTAGVTTKIDIDNVRWTQN